MYIYIYTHTSVFTMKVSRMPGQRPNIANKYAFPNSVKENLWQFQMQIFSNKALQTRFTMKELKHCAATRQLSPISEVCFLGRRPRTRRRGTLVVTLKSIPLIKIFRAEENKLTKYSIEKHCELDYGLTSTKDC